MSAVLTAPELTCLREDDPLNVFMLDHDPVQAAQWHADRHVVKMILETAQLLSGAWHELANEHWRPLDRPGDPTPWIKWQVRPAQLLTEPERVAPGELKGAWWELFGQRIYSKTHANHPCAIWARSLGGNYLWLWRLGMALCAEYTYRYGRHHASEVVLWTLEALPPALLDTAEEWAEVPPCMPEHFKVIVDGCYDSVASYRQYYNTAKRPLHSWTGREAPPWIEA